MEKIYLAAGCRTAIGKYGGSLADTSIVRLGETVLRETVSRAGISVGDIDEVIMGNVLQAGWGQNTTRQSAIAAGISHTVPSYTVNKVCSSGLKSVILAAYTIMAGDADCILAGGMESMSQAPYLLKQHRWGARMGDGIVVDYMVKDGLWDIFNDYHMGVTAENIAEKYGITRAQQDEFAASSQIKAEKARESGRFKDEIAAIEIPQRKKDPVLFKDDEFIRPGTTIEALASLRPAFKKDGTVTAGNASGINDGAAALLVVNEDFLKDNDIKPLARIISSASSGVDPSIMGMGPVPATKKALEKSGMGLEDIGLIEANEAFAAQSLAVIQELGLNSDIVNVNGGAIALGHPIGASGARILVTLLYEMKKRDEKVGLATLCIGGGMGETVIVERDNLCL